MSIRSRGCPVKLICREFQRKIADALNELEELVQGGCKAFAEDSLTVYNDIQRHVAQTGGVAVCVVTPEIRKGGGESTDGIAADVSFQVQCSEKPASGSEISEKSVPLAGCGIMPLAKNHQGGTDMGNDSIIAFKT